MNLGEFELLSPEEARRRVRLIKFPQSVLCYVLWDSIQPERLPATPIYVGTAKGKDRIYNHSRKDTGNVKLARKSGNHAFADFVEARVDTYGSGWLKLSWSVHENFAQAKAREVELIERWGFRSTGGLLFNRSMSG